MNFYKQHQILLKQVLKALQKMFPDARFFERHVGLFYTVNGAPVKVNKPGMADLWGIINKTHIEIEIKTGKAKQTKDQKKWEKVCTEMGCEYYVIRSVDDLLQLQHLQN